jgi:hypothetical protein
MGRATGTGWSTPHPDGQRGPCPLAATVATVGLDPVHGSRKAEKMNRTSTIAALTIGAGCWLPGQAVLPDMGATLPQRMAAVDAARGMEALSAALLLIAGALLVVAAVGLSPAAPTGRGGRLVRWGVVLLGLGGVWLAAGRAAFNLSMLRATAPGVPTEAGLAVLSAPDRPEFVVFPLCLLALLVGPVLLALGVRRSGSTTSWWPLALWVAGIGVFVGTEFTVKPAEILGIGIAATGLIWAGAAIARGPRGEVAAAGAPQASARG